MKKSAIAIAVAAVLAAPAALADVTVSGQLQAQVVSVEGDVAREGLYLTDGGMSWNTATNAFTILDYSAAGVNGGNWGALNFTASEDLGDGLKALAKYSLNVTTGNFGGNARDAYVGLSGGFGTVLAGRMSHPYKTSTIGWDPFVATFMQARNNSGMALDLYGSEVDNALAYANTFGGVKVVAAVVLDEGADPANSHDTNGEHVLSFSVNAPVGPVELAFAYIDAGNFSDIRNLGMGTVAWLVGANTMDDLNAMKLGAKFAAGDFSVAAQYEKLEIGDAGGSFEPSQLYLTGTFKFGNNSVSASYGMSDWDTAGVDDDTYMAIGLNHAFSANTSAFVGYRTNTVLGDGTALFGPGSPSIEESAIGAGLRVKF